MQKATISLSCYVLRIRDDTVMPCDVPFTSGTCATLEPCHRSLAREV